MSNDVIAAIAIGFIGSSHCLVMCGGIVAALQLAMPKANTARKLWLQLVLSLGRLSTYSLFGAAVGYFGASAMQLAGGSLLWLRLVAGLLLIAIALYISRLWFGLLKLEQLGQGIWRYIQPLTKHCLPLDSTKKAYLYGLCWGWLPCGLVYSALSWSLVSGGASAGALVMFAFGLGTLPAILLSGLAAQRLNTIKNNLIVRYLTALILASYGLYTLWLAASRLFH
ncbi:sulfite exporter TauE/SafE family protein [Rheinheimera sp. WS51]|uniref:sulfite exporter TauE/SafE family protein n=1 Tax=Rheinheimera sp. WS51 TaxID=3425886 RepID=UPI003D8A7ECE